MEKIDYIKKKISELTGKLSEYNDRVNVAWWEQTIIDDIKKELGILKSIKDDLQGSL